MFDSRHVDWLEQSNNLLKLFQFHAQTPEQTSIYPHMITSFGRFNLIFNKMALIFLGVLIVFTISSLEFQPSDCLDFIANNEWPEFTQPQSTGLSRLGEMLES